MGFCRFCHGFRGARHNNLPAASSAFRAEIDDPIRNFDDIEIMFNAEHGTTSVNELAEGREKLTDIIKVEASRGLVENIEGTFAGASALALLFFFRRGGIKS